MTRDEEQELKDEIREYQSYRNLAQSRLQNNRYHAFTADFERIIKMCNSKIRELNEKLENK
jgi:hypothetical protein